MKCDEQKLFFYFEEICSGKERDEMETHLQSCETCRGRLDDLEKTIDVFAQLFCREDRQACPVGQRLASFAFGMLEKELTDEVESHISQCPHCREELRLLENYKEEEHGLSSAAMDLPPLSEKALAGIEELKKKSVRHRMEKVLKALLGRGKEALTIDKIPEILDQYFSGPSETIPAYAIASDATISDTELTLREFNGLTDIDFEIGKYQVAVNVEGDVLTVKIFSEGQPVKDVEMTVVARSRGELIGVTDTKGICVIEGIPQERCRLKIRVPDES